MSPCLVVSIWHGRVHTAIDHAHRPNRYRSALGTELYRIPLSLPESHTPIDVLVALFRLKGLLK